MFHGLMSTEDICDRRVDTSDGQFVGRIQDVMIDRETGQVVLAILRAYRSRILGRGLYAVPWERLQPAFGLATFIYTGPSDELKSATELTSPPSEAQFHEVHRLPKGMGRLSLDRGTTRPHF